METLIQQPDKSIWEASENRVEAKAACRMLGNESCDRREIIRARREAAIRRIVEYGGTILAVRDATGVNYNTRLKTEGIGYISDKTLGVNVHSCLAASADGLVFGVLDQSGYNRAEAKDESAGRESKKARPIEEKESFRWLETLEWGMADIPEGVRVITVCDREGDMYERFAKAQSLSKPALIWIVRNRMTAENKRTLDEIRKRRRRGKVEARLPRDSRSCTPEREAVLQIRYASYSVKWPRIPDKIRTLPPSIALQVIYVKEEKPPRGKAPIEWLRKLRLRW